MLVTNFAVKISAKENISFLREKVSRLKESGAENQTFLCTFSAVRINQ